MNDLFIITQMSKSYGNSYSRGRIGHGKIKSLVQNNNSRFSAEEESPLLPLLPGLLGLGKNDKRSVFREKNHIYFRCEHISMDNVTDLCDLIDEYNREQDALQLEMTDAIIISKPIYLHITSLGGNLHAGFLAYDYIKNSKIPIYTIAEGYAFSSGANMFMAGKKRFMTEYSYLMFHKLNKQVIGDSVETYHDMMDNAANVIELMSQIYCIVLNNVRHSKRDVSEQDILTKEKIENHMIHDIFWNYETCKRYGLVDELYTNYTENDVKDIDDIFNNDKINNKPKKIYTAKELRPSEEIINQIRQKSDNKTNIVDMIKKYIAQKDTINKKDAIINKMDSVIDESSLEECEEVPDISESKNTVNSIKRSTRSHHKNHQEKFLHQVRDNSNFRKRRLVGNEKN